MEEKERRVKERISASNLTKLLREFKVDLGTGELITAKTIDANESGLSLLVPINVFKVTNYSIKIYSMDGSFSITDDIVYIKALSPETSRISIMFSPDTELTRYRELLDESQK